MCVDGKDGSFATSQTSIRGETNMAKSKQTAFFCSECGYESSKWMGQCPGCHAWNTMVEEPLAKKTPVIHQKRLQSSTAPATLADISSRQDGIRTDLLISNNYIKGA